MKVFINSTVTELINNELYDYYLFDFKNPLIISDYIKSDKLYTYLIININNPIYKYYIHLFTINNNNIILNYQKPIILKYSGINIYYILIYEQKFFINSKINKRINFNLDCFIYRYNLLLVDKFIFKVIHK